MSRAVLQVFEDYQKGDHRWDDATTAASSACAEDSASERGSSVCADGAPAVHQAVEAEQLPRESQARAARSRRELRIASQRPADISSCTTVVMQGVPRCYTRDMLLGLFDDLGFLERIDFVFVPTDFSTGENLAHAYVNLASPLDAAAFLDAFDGFSRWRAAWCTQACEVVWSCFEQGFKQNVERYRNSPVMHPSVPDSCRPVILFRGARQPFPPPTKKLRPPRRARAVFGERGP